MTVIGSLWHWRKLKAWKISVEFWMCLSVDLWWGNGFLRRWMDQYVFHVRFSEWKVVLTWKELMKKMKLFSGFPCKEVRVLWFQPLRPSEAFSRDKRKKKWDQISGGIWRLQQTSYNTQWSWTRSSRDTSVRCSQNSLKTSTFYSEKTVQEALQGTIETTISFRRWTSHKDIIYKVYTDVL